MESLIRTDITVAAATDEVGVFAHGWSAGRKLFSQVHLVRLAGEIFERLLIEFEFLESHWYLLLMENYALSSPAKESL